jgi:transcriptional regulator with XRE-family HTH domain
MGRATRHVPKRLGEKLRLVRETLGIETFAEMAGKLAIKEVNLYRSTILEYESGEREPPLIVLLRYSELSGFSINELADDRVDLRFTAST